MSGWERAVLRAVNDRWADALTIWARMRNNGVEPRAPRVMSTTLETLADDGRVERRRDEDDVLVYRTRR